MKAPSLQQVRRAAIPCILNGLAILGFHIPVIAVAEKLPNTISLQDLSHETGIHFVHNDGSSGRRYIVETVASGLATFDYNGDDRIDILFPNGAPLPGHLENNIPTRNALYRNDGNWKFTDVTEASGLNDTGYHLGVCT